MAHEHLDYTGQVQQKGPRKHLNEQGKEFTPTGNNKPGGVKMLTLLSGGSSVPVTKWTGVLGKLFSGHSGYVHPKSMLGWGWQPSSLQAATLAKAKQAKVDATKKAAQAKLAPALYPGQPTTAANQKILADRILGKTATAGAPAVDLNFVAAQAAKQGPAMNPAQQIQAQLEKQRLLFPKQAALGKLNAQQQQASNAVLNIFQQKANPTTTPPAMSGWMGI